MTDERWLERAARSWLEEGPTQAPDRPVEAALARVLTTPQERDLRIPWRLPTMFTNRLAVSAIATVLVLAVGGFALSRLTVPGPGASPSASSSATITPTATPLMAGPLRAGTYIGPTLQVADIIAAVNSDSTLTQADRDRIIDVYLEIRGKTTWGVSIEFSGSLMTERQAVDGVFDVGSFGTWAFPNDQTLVYTERLEGKEVVTEFEITVDGDSFTLHRTTPADDAAGEFVTRVIFESGPFTLE